MGQTSAEPLESKAAVWGQYEAAGHSRTGEDMIDKEFLIQHLEMINEYQQEVQRLEEYKAGADMYVIAKVDGMPHTTGVHSDKTAAWMVHREMLEENVTELQSVIKEQELQIESVVRKLHKANEKTVIRLRYIDGFRWEDIAFFFYGNNIDYCDRIDWYILKVQRVHGAALKNIIKVQENNT